jgi:hypothetical protein
MLHEFNATGSGFLRGVLLGGLPMRSQRRLTNQFIKLAIWYPAKPATSRPTAVIKERAGTTRTR